MGFDGTMAFKRWFSPRLHYTVTNRETFGIPAFPQPTAASAKTVDRTDTGRADWDLAWRDLTTKIRALQSLNVVLQLSHRRRGHLAKRRCGLR